LYLFKNILIGILTAWLFSAFIYFEEYDLTNKLINTVFGLSSLALLLYIPKKAVLVAGFFIGLFWFYWIGYSFEYQGVGYMSPIITISFGIIYILFFLPLYFTNKAYIRAILLFGLSFIEPLNWNWLQIELIFVDSYIGIFKYQLAIVLLAFSLPSLLKKQYKYIPLVLLIFAFNYGYPKQEDAPLKIKLIQTDIKQDEKWKSENLYPTIEMIFKEIQNAKKENYDVIVFPESVFPIFMNKNPTIINKLLKLSKNITIIAGSLLIENSQHYNVTYMFQDGTYQVAKKTILVPFGEYIPLPKFARNFVNDTFFNGASDFVTAKAPTDFNIKGIKFRNAICYEATCKELYRGDVKFMIAISNNAWFTPSIEPTLQKLLLKFYARKNGVTIYHSANYKGSGIIK
jgi:apolipoprotein N-acyltransferase